MSSQEEKWTTPNRPYEPRLAIPPETRSLVFLRAYYRCESCSRDGPLELHHRHYNSQGEEKPEDLYALCRDCHQAMHIDPMGEFWVDPVEMHIVWGIGEEEFYR